MQSDTVLRLAVAIARRRAPLQRAEPVPGDLVVEVTAIARCRMDPDAIGYLVGHDDAPYHEDDPLDGSVPVREVWDVRPLSGREQPGKGYQRWENAEFVRVPEDVRRALPGLGIAV